MTQSHSRIDGESRKRIRQVCKLDTEKHEAKPKQAGFWKHENMVDNKINKLKSEISVFKLNF